MQAPDPQIIKDLNAAAQLLAHLSGQYQVDVQQLKALGLKWLAKCVKKWYTHTEEQLRIVLDRLLYFGADPDYDAGETSGADTVTDILQRAEKLTYALLDAAAGFRKAAWDIRADYTPDIYEHIIGAIEKQAIAIERELRLIKTLSETDYIGARLEDAS